jgi:hypothetical protein
VHGNSLTIITTKKFYNIITEQEPGPVPEPMIKFLERGAGHFNSRKLKPTKPEPTEAQSSAISSILQDLQTREYSTALITGPPGKGKSMLSLLLCKMHLAKSPESKITLCDTWDPTNSGQPFSYLYARAHPTAENPLVVALDEVDDIVTRVHNDNGLGYSDGSMLKRKPDWTRFFDRFDRKLFPHTVLLMTSNKPLSWFDNLDPAYMREGRVNLKIQME